MNGEIRELLARMEFVEKSPDVFFKELHGHYSTVCYIDFRHTKDKDGGGCYATYLPAPDMEPDVREFVDDTNDVEILRQYKIARDEILLGHKQIGLISEGEHGLANELITASHKAGGYHSPPAPPYTINLEIKVVPIRGTNMIDVWVNKSYRVGVV